MKNSHPESMRGMPDILPNTTALWQNVETKWLELVRQYGHKEIRTPIIEEMELFKRSIGEITDVIEKEMFLISKKSKDSLSYALRPEGTASCVRAGIQHNLFRQVQKLWYYGPMFRYERPQLGRYRQFSQLGAETFGLSAPNIEAEHIAMLYRFWKELGIANNLTLQINSIGERIDRQKYKQDLISYLNQYAGELDSDSKRRLTTNPLRILDSKIAATQDIIARAPSILDYIDSPSKQHFAEFQEFLVSLNIPFIINKNLVRGLDYYNRTVYEWVAKDLGAQSTICAGGRFDNLVTDLGYKNKVPATGFALGLDRLLLLLDKDNCPQYEPFAYFITLDERHIGLTMNLVEKLRNSIKLPMVVHLSGGSLKTQLKKANKASAKVAIILGDIEVSTKTVSIKILNKSTQYEISQDNLLATLQKILQEDKTID